MDSKKQLLKSIRRGFDKELKSSVKDISIVSNSNANTSYDPVTGVVGNSGTPILGRGMFRNYSSKYVDGIRVKMTDQKVTLIQDEWSSYTPNEGDLIDDTYRVIRVSQDAFGATWTLQVRSE